MVRAHKPYKLRTIVDPLERFMSHVWPEPNSGCWLWDSSYTCTKQRPYGRFTIRNEHFPAHRWIYEFYNGQVPKNLVIDHKCRNTICVNPNHLRVLTHKENLLCGVGFSANNKAKMRCSRGHEFSGDNLHITKTGRRQCLACRKINNDEFYKIYKYTRIRIKNPTKAMLKAGYVPGSKPAGNNS